MRFLYLFPREHLFDKDLERLILELGQRMLDQLIPQSPLVLFVSTPQAASLKPDPLSHKRAQIWLRSSRLQLASTQGRQIDNPPISRGSVEVLRKRVRPD